jgi:hypothetical protein
MKKTLLTAAAFATPMALAHPAVAAPGDPVRIGEGMTIDPIVEARLRYEGVDQPALDADAVTMRIRAGAEFRMSQLSLLVEGEGTMGIANEYNAFPFPEAEGQRRLGHSVVADPMNVELNRLQFAWRDGGNAITIGRQRINLDDQRWVGSVGWRQNEQTFDAVRGEAKFGPVSLDGTWAIGQRSIFGVDAGPRQSMDGNFFFAGAGVKAGPVTVKGFAYLLDYDEPFFLANSSKTFGLRATGSFKLGGKAKLNLAASYARQSDYKNNPFDYEADYIAGEAGLTFADFGVVVGYELLGSDDGRSVQTPMATLHKFNGWADVFLATPATGLEDLYGGVTWKASGVRFLPGLNAAVTYHEFDSDAGGIDYGSEWDASLGFKLGRVALLAKYGDYNARGFGVDTRKLWLQAEIAY